MKTHKIDEMKRGWFVGNFEPSAYKNPHLEVAYFIRKKGKELDLHYHEKCKEVNLLISGNLIINGKEMGPGDIFIIEPFEVADITFLEDCEIVCVKTSSESYDKIKVEKIC